MNSFEIIAVLFSLLSVTLTVYQSKWCWLSGIIGIIFYAILFLEQGLMGNFWLQFLFLGQSVLGIWNWDRSLEKKYVTWIGDKTFLYTLTALSYMLTVLILEINGGKMVYLDAATTVLSVFAMFLIVFKVIDGWYYWITADLLYIWIFYQQGFFLSSAIYFLFLCLSLSGLIKWSKSFNIL